MLWGRQKELTLIKELLSERIPPSHTSRLYILEGAPGMGKSSVVAEVQEHLKASKKPKVIINLANWASVLESSDSDFVYDALTTINFDKQEMLEGEQWGGYWERFLNLTRHEAPIVVVLVDGYDSLPSQKKVYLKEHIVDPMRGYLMTHDARYILTSNTEFSPTDLQSFWGDLSVQTFKLGGLGEDDIKEWLRAAKEPEDGIDEILEQTAGVPARIQEYMTVRKQMRQERMAREVEEELLKGYTDSQRHLIALAAMVRALSEGMVDYLQGEGTGKESIAWLSAQPNLDGELDAEGFRIKEELREKLVAWYSIVHPVSYNKIYSRVKALETVAHGLGTTQERQLLGYLSLLNYFTPQLIKDVYGPDSGMAINYINRNPNMFEEADGMWNISTEYVQTAEVAGELISREAKERFLKLVDESWQERREAIFKLIETTEKDMKNQKEDLVSVSKGLEDMEPRLIAMQKKFELMMHPAHAKKKDLNRVQEGWNTAGVLLVLLGIVWLYVSVLASHGVEIVHCMVGGFLILMGLTAPRIGRSQVVVSMSQNSSGTPSMSLAAQSAQKNLQYLRMRSTALEQKKKMLVGRIADNKKKLETWEKQLQKPYV